MIAAAYSRVSERLLVTDPGLVRLFNALRVALAVLLTGFAGVAWTLSHSQPITLAAPAILFAMVAPLFTRDARPLAWFGTLFWLYGCACASFAVASVLSRYPLAGDAGFLLVMFAGMLCQACGPRALGCALLGVVCFYLGLYLHPGVAHLMQALALSVVGPLMVALVGRVLLPARAAFSFRLAVRTVTLRATRVLHASDKARAAAVSALNEAALALEEQLAVFNPPHVDAIRERIVEMEVAAGQFAFASGRDGADVLRHAIARLANTARAREMRRVASLSADQDGMRSFLARIADARGKLCWLPAVRATTAAFLAMLIGHSLSPERWFWAVITTFVVFLGTRSRADTVYRGAQRIVGTLAGALVSIVLIAPLHGSPALLVAAMLVCVFGWAYYILSAYGPGVFFITVLVGLVYGELGFALGPLVEMRIEEVLVGCAVSFAVAVLMMPLAATRHVETRLGTVLVALREVVRLVGVASRDEEGAVAMRKLDRSWHDLRIALKPLQTQRVVVWNPDVELATGSLLCCLHWARVVSGARASASSGDVAGNAVEMGSVYRASALARLDALIARYGAGGGAAASDAEVHVDASDAAPIAQLDGALAQLGERLGKSGGAKRRVVLGWGVRA